jgi:peroxin-11C
MSQTRANLRLLDDIPMIQYSMDYGFGEKEPDRIMAMIGVLTNAVDHVYYPVDKICWMIEQKIINSKNSSKWDTLNSLLWVASIYLNLMK